MAAFARSARWAGSKSENDGDRALFKKPQNGVSQRAVLGHPNTLRTARPTHPTRPLKRSAILTRRGGTRRPLARSQTSASVESAKEEASQDPVSALNIGHLSVNSKEAEAYSTSLLSADVPDIDAGDSCEPQLCSQYAKDIYEYLFFLEEKVPVKARFLQCQPLLTASMRTILVNWLAQVHMRFHLLQETLFLTVSIIDRYLQVEPVDRTNLQLIGVTAMFLASKYEEMHSPIVDDFVGVTANAYSKKELLQTERRILTAIQWNLGRPLPLHFLRRISKAGQVDTSEHCMAKYALELSLLSYEMSWVRPSKQAAAALCLSIKLLGDGHWDSTLTHYGRYPESKLVKTMAHMATLMLNANRGPHMTIFEKFKHGNYGEASSLAMDNAANLKKIANGISMVC